MEKKKNKKTYFLKRLLTLVVAVSMLSSCILTVSAADAYTVNFVTDGHATVDVFYTQDYTTADETEVTSASARSSSTGEVDTSGDGQVNFRVNADDGYEIVSVTGDANFKNLKDSSDTGVEGIYRMTKITGNVNVTITTRQTSSNPETETGTVSDIVINEIESNGDVTDWVEIYNKGNLPVDISGWYIMDDNNTRLTDGKTFPLKSGNILNPGEFFVFENGVNFNFGLGAPDEVNLYDSEGTLVEKYSWSAHASGVYARIPDGTGSLVDVEVSTKGAANGSNSVTAPEYDTIPWPGSDQVDTWDEGVTMFGTDSSGLDFYNGQLYCINNKKGTFWVLDVAKDGTLSYADGFTATGKNLAFYKDAANAADSNPDTEGITVTSSGLAYAASERDNNNKNVNCNVILQFDPWSVPQADGNVVVASQEWDITALLPDVVANAGIEAVEWVPDAAVDGKLFDQNTGAVFNHNNYPDAIESGVFFVALEDNGHIYALVLNSDGSAQVIADIDAGMGHAMALDYDAYTGILWVCADNDCINTSAQVVLNGTENPDITLVAAPAGMDTGRNNEGFAIAEPEYTVNGLRPVYHFMDGVNTGVLTISYLNTEYTAPSDAPETPDNQGSTDAPETPDNQGSTGASETPDNQGSTDTSETPDNKDSSGTSESGGSITITGNDSGTKSDDAPKTGDAASVAVMFMIMSASGAAIIFMGKKRKISRG